MSFEADNVAVLQHAIKQGLVHTQHSHNAPPLKAKEPVQYTIVILTSPDGTLLAPLPNSPQSLAYGDVVTIDHHDMSPGDGVPGAVDNLVNEASQALCDLQRLEEQREEIKSLLGKIASVQNETRTSVYLSKSVVRAHWDFCAHMQETLQHAAAEKDCHLTHDSDVVAAGKVVGTSFTTLGDHVFALHHALSDVANEMRQLGEKAKHHLLHPIKHHVWGKIREVLVEIVKMITLVISGIGQILGLVHPIAGAVGKIAEVVHEFLKKHSLEHGHHNGTKGDHIDADASIRKTLDLICNEMPKHIEDVQNKLQDCYARIEQPMLKIEARLKTHCMRMDPKEAEMAADMWREMREKLNAIVKTHCC
ncbi:hypothetical protein DAEQUDRAFT_814922 [Daedalea quercina L-15889]|uniref:Uncharacterized protein n=1 Tax=Daedalea quercina L-15889 TaxID=1314783 RepID=A0A165LJX1_9APHY|nr:hypothetical protein DAEQUDRAFT_814922 [Daedalea quercina L-15889]